MKVQEIPLKSIRRPLPRATDPEKVRSLMESIRAIGLQDPIEVLEVDGQYYGFSGYRRFVHRNFPHRRYAPVVPGGALAGRRYRKRHQIDPI